MNNLVSAKQTTQIIRCDHGDLSFAIDKTDVLSIQRTERLNYIDQSDGSPGQEWLSDLEQSQAVIGWISDGVRKIPICQFERRLEVDSDADQSGFSESDETARVILFTPASQGTNDFSSMTPPWGLLVDRVQGIVEVHRSKFHATPPILWASSLFTFRAIVRNEGEILMVLDPQSMNPHQSPSAAYEFDAFLRDENYLARLGAAMQVSGKLPGTGEDKAGIRGLVVFSHDHDLGDARGLSIGFSISQVAEILESASVVPVPNRREHVGGVIFWRDIAVPLVDLAARMGLPSSGDGAAMDKAQRYIIVRHPLHVNGSGAAVAGNEKHLIFAAIGINSDVRILRLPLDSRPSSRPLPVDPAMVRGQVELETETLVIPELQNILTPQAG